MAVGRMRGGRFALVRGGSMTRIRGSVAALAVGLLLAGCGPDDSAPATSGAGSAGATTQPDGGKATAQAGGGDGTSQGNSGGGGRWCEAVEAWSDATLALIGTGKVEKADQDRARARLKDLKAAAPAEIKTQVAAVSEFFAVVIDTAGKSPADDPMAFARWAGVKEKLDTGMPPVSEYTAKHCPGLEKRLEQVGVS
ncbi:hypothetical protein ABZ671_23670 [Micromonospora sp. NPDC006766]|uniref:hypothetical protein n=1 Tax=Micromonospora sp. NPDC006766 TaxID=3154778 RepID=UPI0034024EB8